MKIMVTGAHGQLGTEVVLRLENLGIECVEADLPELDITDENAVSAFIADCAPDAVIHCAAYTAVDAAEDNREACRLVNETGTINLARACSEQNAKLLYISTDYVFSEGDAPHETYDEKGPVNYYGVTKLAGENAVIDICEKYFIVRTSWVFGVHGKNFVKTMLRLCAEKESVKVVYDQLGSPTYAPDLAQLLCNIIQTEKYGIYHATGEGICTWAQFAAEIAARAGLPARIIPVSSEEYAARAKRPENSCLSKASLDKAGFSRLPDWHTGLMRFLDEVNQ